MYCKYCQKEFDDYLHYCPNCREKLVKKENLEGDSFCQNNVRPLNKYHSTFAFVVSIILIIFSAITLLLAAALFFQNLNCVIHPTNQLYNYEKTNVILSSVDMFFSLAFLSLSILILVSTIKMKNITLHNAPKFEVIALSKRTIYSSLALFSFFTFYLGGAFYICIVSLFSPYYVGVIIGLIIRIILMVTTVLLLLKKDKLIKEQY